MIFSSPLDATRALRMSGTAGAGTSLARLFAETLECCGRTEFSGLEIRPRKPRFYPVTDRSLVWPSSGCDVRLTALGGIPERSKGSGCKPDGYAFPGSNPGPATYHTYLTYLYRHSPSS